MVHNIAYLESEVTTIPIGHLERLQSLDATGVVGHIESIKELVKLLKKHSCLPSFFSEEEFHSLCYGVTQDL